MKKIGIFLLGMIMFSSCKSTFNMPTQTNQDFTAENIKAQGINPETMQSAYTSVSQGFTAFQDPNAENIQQTDNGSVLMVDKLSGVELHIPKTEPVRYISGSKKGEIVVLKNGTVLTREFLAPVVVVEEIDSVSGYAERYWVNFGTDSLPAIFPMVRKKKISSYSQNRTTPSYGLRTRSSGKRNSFSSTENRYFFDVKTYQQGDVVPKGFVVFRPKNKEESYKICFVHNGTNYFVLEDYSGNFWFVSEKQSKVYLERFHLMKFVDARDKKIIVPNSKKIGEQ